MYHIHCLNKISPKGTALLTDNYAITDDRNQADGVLVRSPMMPSADATGLVPRALSIVPICSSGTSHRFQL